LREAGASSHCLDRRLRHTLNRPSPSASEEKRTIWRGVR
jgi:hypothetical protein